MRLTTLAAAYAFAAVALLINNPLCAQSGSRIATPGLAPAISAPSINVPSVTGSLNTSAGQIVGSSMTPTEFTGNSVLSSPMAYSEPMSYSGSMAYSGPVTYGNTVAASQSGSYGPVNVGPYPQGPPCCDLSPTQPGYCRKPVTSCCGTIGPLGIPPLLTPIRNDTPPVGGAVGRPLFGRWTGF